MNKLTRILVVVDRTHDASGLIGKAVTLARGSGAHIELFLCASEQAYELARAYDRQGIEEARTAAISEALTYLTDLRACADAADIAISLDARCETPLYEGIVRKVLQSTPDLVIKRAALADNQQHAILDANDWELMRTCPATLLLSRGRAWRKLPRFAVAVDVSGEETRGVAAEVMEAARTAADAWHADLEVMYGECAAGGAAVPLRADTLRSLCDANGVSPDHVHLLRGHPEETLIPFAGKQGYDALIVGALTHQAVHSVTLGTLTSRLLNALECDFILVRPADGPSASGMWPARDAGAALPVRTRS